MGRSGTSWISRSLGDSPQLTYVGEAWLVRRLEALTDWFAKLHDEWTFTPWSRQGVDRAAFVRRLAPWYLGLLEDLADGHRLVEKTPDWNALHLDFLRELYPDAYYVLVYRDGRNCVASLQAKKARDGEPFDFAEACGRWGSAMDVFSRLRAGDGVRRVTFVRYEELVQDFDAVFAGLCAFADIAPFRPSERVPNSSFAEGEGAGDFNARWRSWSPEQRGTFKQRAGRQLVEWGYLSSTDAW
jgi:hypothetical protein